MFRISLITLLFFFTGCARVGYLAEQGVEQFKIQWLKDRKNLEVLNDPTVPKEVKRKILLIQEYKKFFYDYFSEKETGIYTRTTMLDGEAVSYLVIAAPHNKIEAHEFEFPIFGSFPYIGFFKKASAIDFAKKLEKEENLVTFIRPVFAYSTLGYLEDRILSSFFEYNDIELAELVFHELFHTVFFVKDNVDLNENLANFYGKELLKEYFKDQNQLIEYFKKVEKKEILTERIVELISILQGEFDKLGVFLDDKKADEITKRFVSDVFLPEVKKTCGNLGLTERDCEFRYPWNQASFAAFLTYEKEQDFLTALKKSINMSLVEFLAWLRSEDEKFQKSSHEESFMDYLKARAHAPPSAD